MTQDALPRRILGRTGLEVTTLGFGALELRKLAPDTALSRADAGALLNRVLDAGINFIDTAPDYGLSEELIGEYIGHRRGEFVIATKCGCPVALEPRRRGDIPLAPGVESDMPGLFEHTYSRANIVAAVEQSLRRLRTDYLDIVQFHMSPSVAELASGDAVATLQDLRREGKVRFIGVSSILPHLPGHLAMGVFDVFQIPYSAVQREHEALISEVARAGGGTVIRGGAARGAPSAEKDWSVPVLGVAGDAPRNLWDAARLDELLDGMSRIEFTLRFTLSHPDLHTAIIGTSRSAHLDSNVAIAAKGPLPETVYAEAKRRLDVAERGESAPR